MGGHFSRVQIRMGGHFSLPSCQQILVNLNLLLWHWDWIMKTHRCTCLGHSVLLMISWQQKYWGICVARATLWFCPFFFYAADVSLFLETGKGTTSAVFTESVDLRPDWWIWHYILESSSELLPRAIKDGFRLSTRQRLWCVKRSGDI